MIQARVQHGQLEVQEPLPAEWEGQLVNILPLTPDDPIPDLEERLSALQALGPVELDPDERLRLEMELRELDGFSRDAMRKLARSQPLASKS